MEDGLQDSIPKQNSVALFHRHPVTPYDGMRLCRRDRTTLLRGKVKIHAGHLVGETAAPVVNNRLR